MQPCFTGISPTNVRPGSSPSLHQSLNIRANQRDARDGLRLGNANRTQRWVLAHSQPSVLEGVLSHTIGDSVDSAHLTREAADGIKLALQRDPVNTCEVAGFVDTLLTTPSPFLEEQLGGGPWQVVYSRGPLLWQGWSEPGKIVNLKNVASQDFRPEDRSAVNKAEILGSKVFVTASGSYAPHSEQQQQEEVRPGSAKADEEDMDVQEVNTPVRIDVSIAGGALHCFGKKLGLPFIRGKGSFNVMYVDDDLRVLRNGDNANSGLVVQIRQDVLPELCGRHLK